MNIRVINHRIEIDEEEDGKFIDFCEDLDITRVYHNLFSGEQKVHISLHCAVTGKQEIILPRSQINADIINILSSYGLTLVNDPIATGNLREILFTFERSAPHSYQHDKLGFHHIDGKLVFLAHKPIGISDPLKSSSEYAYPEKTKPSGTFENWRDIVLDEVIGNHNMELALSMSALAPVAYLLKREKVISLIPLVALIGRSSTGKSISLKLISSVYGSPEESYGLISDMNATQNALMAQLSNNAGIPSIFDETSAYDGDFSSFAYHLPKGRDKLRCDGEGKVRTPIYFSGAILFSGEKSLLEQTNGNGGLFARLLEITLPWTVDEHHANRLEYGCRHNYGTAVYPLLSYILDNAEFLEEGFYDEYDIFKDLIPDSAGIEDRLVKIYAMISLSARIIGDALDLPLNIDKIRQILIDIHGINRTRLNTPEKVWDKIKDLILNNYSRFPVEMLTENAHSVWGEYGEYQHRRGFWIRADKYEEFLRETHGDEINGLDKIFSERGWLARTRDRHYKIEHKLGGVKVKCYFLYMTDFASKKPASHLTTNSEARSKASALAKQNSQREKLLAENDDDE